MTMTLIEGVGDEVTLFFVLALLSVIACLAWWTTRVTDRPLRIQTIIVGQRVIHVDERGEPTTAEAAAAAAAAEAAGGGAESQPAGAESAEPEPSCEEDEDGEVELVQSEERSSEDASEDVHTATGVAEDRQVASEGNTADSASEVVSEGKAVKSDAAPQFAAESEPVAQGSSVNNESVSQATAAAPTQDGAQLEDTSAAASVSSAAAAESTSAPEPEPIPDAAPDARQQLRHRRLAFMARQATGSGTPATSDVPDGAGAQRTEQETMQRTEPDTADRTTDTARTADTAERAAQAAAPTEGAQTITVKLKFLNDTQRLAEGRRTEPLADFKRRHFPAETAANRIVRLIFNGRVLPDQETLSQCGLYHNCVVHCHVSANPRPPPAGAAAGGAAVGGAGGGGGGGGGAPHELDIGVLLYPVLTSVVTLVWGLRLRYPELFSGTAVILLAALTLLLACFAAATFFPLERLPMAQAAMAAGARQQQRGR